MSLCAMCGLALAGTEELCAYHVNQAADDWAANNRIMAHLLHRGVEPVRLTLAERDETTIYPYYGSDGG